ncbi:MAG: prephenate dehydrogenase/arogenate dehydrogenase family protein [Nitrososphaerota archaeon]
MGIIGLGSMGRQFAQLFQEYGCKVLTYDIDKGLKDYAEAKGYTFLDEGSKLVSKSDVVIYCVPISKTVEVIKRTAPYAKPGSFLTDVTSLKKGPVEAMLMNSNEDVDVIGMHPLYSPMQPMRGQLVILTPVRAKRWLDWLLTFLRSNGARVKLMAPEHHDRMMALVQCITHLLNIALPLVAQSLGIRAEESFELSSPIYALKFYISARILDQNSELYADIMGNPYADKAVSSLLDRLKALKEAMDKKEDFIKLFIEASQYFKPEQRKRATMITNDIIAYLTELEESDDSPKRDRRAL